MEIFKLTFGKYYAINGNSVLEDVMYMKDEDGVSMTMYLYVTYDGENYTEIVTGLNIPKVIDSSVPGFGVYGLEAVVTTQDYERLIYFVTQGKKCKNQFYQALKNIIDYLNEIYNKYIQTHMDQFGMLKDFNPQREINDQNKFNECVTKALNLVRECTSSYTENNSENSKTTNGNIQTEYSHNFNAELAKELSECGFGGKLISIEEKDKGTPEDYVKLEREISIKADENEKMLSQSALYAKDSLPCGNDGFVKRLK